MTGSEVRRIRRRLGLTQTQFAKRVGVHLVTVSRWERGEMGIRESAAKLIRLLAQMKAKGTVKRKAR